MINEIKKKENLRYVILYTVVVALYQLVMKEYTGDTVSFFARAIDHLSISSLVEILISRYMTWTSRILIEIPLFILAHGMHMVLFGILNVLVHIMLLLALMKLTDYKHNRLLVCLLIMYPVALFCGSGWMTAYITYFWPLSLSIVSMVSLKKMYEREKIHALEAIFYVLCQIFGTDLEVSAVFYTCILATFTIMMIWEKKFECRSVIMTVIHFIVCAGNLIFALTCPGNEARKVSNIDFWFPSYTSFTLIDKVVLGINTAVSYLIGKDFYWIMLCLLIVVVLIGGLRKEKHSVVITAIIPLFATCVLSFLRPVVENYYPDLVALFNDFETRKYVDSTNYNSTSVYIPFIIYSLIMIMVVLTVLELFEDVKQSFFIAAVLVSGFLSRLTLGFSPTVFSSGLRTFVFMDFAMIYAIVKIYDSYKANNVNKRVFAYSKCVAIVIEAFAVLANIVAICSVYYY